MFYTYVLFSKKYNKIYIGQTNNLEIRFKYHNELAHKGYTVKFRPWTIAFFETFETRQQALKREKFLKSGIGREYIWNKIKSLGLAHT